MKITSAKLKKEKENELPPITKDEIPSGHCKLSESEFAEL
jgi:hypothetical protein